MQATQNPKNKSEFSQLSSRYLPYWPYFLISVIICCGLAEVYLRYKTPVYQISASILIRSDNNDNNNNSSFLSPLDAFSSKKIVENETAILKSHTLMDQVVKKLGLYASVYLEGTIHDQSGYIESPVSIEAKYPEKLRIPDKPAKIYFTYDGSKVEVNGQVFPLNSWVISPWGEIRFIPNPNYVITPHSGHHRLFFTLQSVSGVADGLISNLDAIPSSKLATIINISLKDQVPERGKNIINALLHFYDQAALENKNILAANAVSFLDQRLKNVSASLDSIEIALQQYKANKGGVDLSEQSKLILGNVSENDQQISAINVQLATLHQIETFVRGNGGNPGIVPTSAGTSDDNVLSSYLTNLYDAELQYDRLRKTTAENNPLLLSLKDQIDKIKPTILQYVENKINTLDAAKANLNTTAGQYTSTLRTIPQKQRELLEISRQQAIKSDLYDFLLKKREDAALSYAAAISDTRIVDRAVVSPGPVSPKKPLALGTGLLIGLIIPSIFLKFNEKITSKDEISKILDYPILGEISSSKTKNMPIVANDSRNFIAEQFRQIRTSMAPTLDVNNYKNKIMITSAISGEGKSFISSNLAVNLALSGKKVLLMDLDLHKKGLDKVFGTVGQIGMSDYLLGDEIAEEIIYKTKVHENLNFIPAGQVTSDLSELILNGKLNKLLDYVEAAYDYIIMDVAPVNIITDGYVLSKLCDATILVVRYKYTPKSDLITLQENIPSRGLKNAGIVFNGIHSISSKGYGHKYYGYVGKPKRKERRILT